MRQIELDIGKLVGYAVVEEDGLRVKKLGSTKLGCKSGGHGGGGMNNVIEGEMASASNSR